MKVVLMKWLPVSVPCGWCKHFLLNVSWLYLLVLIWNFFVLAFQDMECMQALRHHAHAEQKPANLMMMLVHVTPMDIKGVVEEVQGSERVHRMEEEADHMGEAMALHMERISLILMDNMFTEMTQIFRQEKVTGYARTLSKLLFSLSSMLY